MKTQYKDILEQAKLEKEKKDNVGKPDSLQTDKSETVNLCLTLEKLVVEAIKRYMEQEGW